METFMITVMVGGAAFLAGFIFGLILVLIAREIS